MQQSLEKVQLQELNQEIDKKNRTHKGLLLLYLKRCKEGSTLVCMRNFLSKGASVRISLGEMAVQRKPIFV
jgi:hypothetical protein